MSADGERLAAFEQSLKHITDTLRQVVTGQDALTQAVRDLAVLKRDMDYHRRDIDLAHDGIRDIRASHASLDARVDKLEGKELLNNLARAAMMLAAMALIKLAWDSDLIVNMERSVRDDHAEVVNVREKK